MLIFGISTRAAWLNGAGEADSDTVGNAETDSSDGQNGRHEAPASGEGGESWREVFASGARCCEVRAPAAGVKLTGTEEGDCRACGNGYGGGGGV